MTIWDVFLAAVILGILLLVAAGLKQRIPLLRRFYIPESVIAGSLALVLGPEVLGKVVQYIVQHIVQHSVQPLDSSGESFALIARVTNGNVAVQNLAQHGLFPATVAEVWRQVPEVLINVVFATLFLGETIPNPAQIWRKAGPQIAFGQSLAWGQYVVGLAAVLWILQPLSPIDPISPIAGCLIEITFEGGHGAAAGMAKALRSLGFEEGPALAYVLATVGIVSGITMGTLLVNWGCRQGHVQAALNPDRALMEPPAVLADRDRPNPLTGLLVDPLSVNAGFVALAIALGWLLLQGLRWLEALTWEHTGFVVMSYVPLFPFGAIGGVLIQLLLSSGPGAAWVSRPLQEHLAGLALDLVIVTALASISLTVLGENGWVLLVLAGVGVVWNVLGFLYLAPRIFPDYWFERGIGDMGQSMGVTATGILLIRMVDPQNRTGALEGFAYKQLFFAPFLGGGLVTAATPILIVQFGPKLVWVGTFAILLFWIGFGWYLCRRLKAP